MVSAILCCIETLCKQIFVNRKTSVSYYVSEPYKLSSTQAAGSSALKLLNQIIYVFKFALNINYRLRLEDE